MLPYRATTKLINSTNIAIWNDTPNLLYTLLGCVFIQIKMRAYKQELEIITNDILKQNAEAKGNENKPNYTNREFSRLKSCVLS